MSNGRYEVKEEELPSDEYDNEVNHWYIYDNETDTVVNNEWFDTEKRAKDYMEIRLMTEEEKAQAKAQEMLEYWGERCDTFDGDCIACHAWKNFDETGEIAK